MNLTRKQAASLAVAAQHLNEVQSESRTIQTNATLGPDRKREQRQVELIVNGLLFVLEGLLGTE